jgi:hypothetical protein
MSTRAVLASLALPEIGLFVAAAAHKVQMLRDVRVDHPLLSTFSGFARYPRAWMLAALITELAGVVLALTFAVVGFGIFTALLCIYTVLLSRLPEGESCQCFGTAIPEPKPSHQLARNLALAVVALAVSAGSAVLGHPAYADPAAWGLAACIAAPVAGIGALRRILANPAENPHDSVGGSAW